MSKIGLLNRKYIKMNIFCDGTHHEALAKSLQFLFEKRLGHKLFFPYGMEWFDSGNWLVGKPYGNSARSTALQFLSGALPNDGTGVVNVPNKMTFEEFKNTPIDIMIASYYDHNDTYDELIKKYHPHAKLITQYGNSWPVHPKTRNLLSSTAPIHLPCEMNACWYREEFQTKIYEPDGTERVNLISCFSNAININSLFSKDWSDFLSLEKLLPEYEFRSYGGGCRDGSLQENDVAKTMKKSRFIYHGKENGDGYGFVAHQIACSGTPIIFKGHQYKGKLAEIFLEDGKTGYDIDIRHLDGVVGSLKTASNDEILSMGHEIRQRFIQNVDFDNDAHKVRDFLEALQ